MNAGSSTARIPALSPERARRWALRRTLRDLRQSIERGRRISLPNLLRLYQRRSDALGISQTDLPTLRDRYRQIPH